jgi:hypothetical protein
VRHALGDEVRDEDLAAGAGRGHGAGRSARARRETYSI